MKTVPSGKPVSPRFPLVCRRMKTLTRETSNYELDNRTRERIQRSRVDAPTCDATRDDAGHANAVSFVPGYF